MDATLNLSKNISNRLLEKEFIFELFEVPIYKTVHFEYKKLWWKITKSCGKVSLINFKENVSFEIQTNTDEANKIMNRYHN